MAKVYQRFLAVWLILAIFFGQIPRTYVEAKKTPIRFKNSRVEIYVNHSQKVNVIVSKKIYKKKICWKTSNKKIASVSQKGIVKGKKAGKAKITAYIKGSSKKAVCQVVIKKKTKKPTPKSSKSPKTTPLITQKPSVSAKPTETPQSTATPEPTKSPQSSVAPTDTPQTSTTPKPTETVKATATPKPTQYTLPILDIVYGQVNGKDTTVYLLDTTYEGGLKISFNGKQVNFNGKVRTGLYTLETTKIANQKNSAGTIGLSRKDGDLYWTVTDLELGLQYYMYAEKKQTFSASYNCGALYFLGDTRDVISVQ